MTLDGRFYPSPVPKTIVVHEYAERRVIDWSRTFLSQAAESSTKRYFRTKHVLYVFWFARRFI
jgi:hypothetical protein